MFKRSLSFFWDPPPPQRTPNVLALSTRARSCDARVKYSRLSRRSTGDALVSRAKYSLSRARHASCRGVLLRERCLGLWRRRRSRSTSSRRSRARRRHLTVPYRRVPRSRALGCENGVETRSCPEFGRSPDGSDASRAVRGSWETPSVVRIVTRVSDCPRATSHIARERETRVARPFESRVVGSGGERMHEGSCIDRVRSVGRPRRASIVRLERRARK